MSLPKRLVDGRRSAENSDVSALMIPLENFGLPQVAIKGDLPEQVN
jgi:hypothetical protein